MPKKGEKGTEGQRRTALNNGERQQLRAYHIKNRSVTQQELTVWFESEFGKSIAQSQIHEILSDKYKHLDGSTVTDAKRNRRRHYEALEVALYDWSKSQDHELSNKELKRQGEMIWESMPKILGSKDKNPTFSDGWLSKWRRLYLSGRKIEGISVRRDLESQGIFRGVDSVSKISEVVMHSGKLPSSPGFSICGVIPTRNASKDIAGTPSRSGPFTSPVAASEYATGRITELPGCGNTEMLVSGAQFALGKKKRKVNQNAKGNKLLMDPRSALEATIENFLSRPNPFDSKTCDNISLLSCLSVVNQNNIYPNAHIKPIFSPIFTTIDEKLGFLQDHVPSRYFCTLGIQREVIPQVRQCLNMLIGAEMFQVLPAVQIDYPGGSSGRPWEAYSGVDRNIWSHFQSSTYPFLELATRKVPTLSKPRQKGLEALRGSLDIGGGRFDIQTWLNHQKTPVDTRITITRPVSKRFVPQVIFHIEETWNHTPIMPTISFRNLIHPDSEIIRIAKEGTVSELQYAFSQGIGSPYEYDGELSLARYALDYENYDVVEFLLPFTDVNAFEEKWTLFTLFLTYMQCSVDEMHKMFRAMLSNGADPSLPTYLSSEEVIINYRTSAFNKKHSTNSYTNTYDYDVAVATSCLWKLCSNLTELWPFGSKTERIIYTRRRNLLLHLLGSGADVTAKDQYGQTCLHNVLGEISIMHSTVFGDIILILLVTGANVFSEHPKVWWSLSDEARRCNLEELWIGVLEELGYDPANVMQFDNNLISCHQLWDDDNDARKDTPWMERRFMTRAFEYRPTEMTLQEYLHNDDFFLQKLKTELEDPKFVYWYELEEDSDSDYDSYEDCDEEDEWKNDYEADERYTCTEDWYYYQCPVLPEAYPNRHVERKRLGIPRPGPEKFHECDFCWNYRHFREDFNIQWLQAS